jgi:UDP-glucose 4-epimerase
VKNTPAFGGDICEPADFDKVSHYKIDGVLHFAGKALVGESAEKPELYRQTNVVGGMNLLTAMKNHAVRHFIFSSTCATYGIPEQVPIPEDHPQTPINVYGQTKLDFEHALSAFHANHGISYLSLRYFNAAGADADGELEKITRRKHTSYPRAAGRGGRQAGRADFRHRHPTPDGTRLRDYIHVADLARAHVMGLQLLMENRISSQAINLGTGHGARP